MKGDLHQCYTVIQALSEGEAALTLTLDHALPAQAGQFVMVWLPGLDEKPFSIMNDSPLTLAVAIVGPFTTALSQKGVGDRIWVRGPYGHGFEAKGQRPLLVGGGCGAAPLALLARQIAPQVKEINVALGASTVSRLMLTERFRALGCRVHLATDDGSAGHAGTIVEAVTPLIEARTVDAVYACGPEGMLVNLARLCTHTEISCQISLERYMRCGIGLCGSCHYGDLLVCQDGPVVLAERWLGAIDLSGRGRFQLGKGHSHANDVTSD